MQNRELGSTGMKVSYLGFGVSSAGSVPPDSSYLAIKIGSYSEAGGESWHRLIIITSPAD